MREIGGYFEVDSGVGRAALPAGVLLNSGRNALRHIVRQLGIRSLWVPDYTCPVVWEALEVENCALRFYSVGRDMLPVGGVVRNDFVLYTNYYGCCGAKVEQLAREYPNLIVDCAQAFHAKPKGRASFYSPRKFFGVADGGVAFGVESVAYERDDSSRRGRHLVMRREKGAAAGYSLFQAAEASLDEAPIRQMSEQTMSALERLDMAEAARKRRANFAFLDERLHTAFPLSFADDDVPMVYPLVTDDGAALRRRLIAKGIYVAKYWPGLCARADALADRVVPLPIDQRYGTDDMAEICEVVHG